MKSAQELASAFWSSPEEQKRQATALRRLAGGLRSVTSQKESIGLSEKELSTLLGAIAVLNSLAANHAKAQQISQKKRDDREKAEREIRVEMNKNFNKLSSIADKVAFIAAEQSYQLRKTVSLNDLSWNFKECIDSLSYSLSVNVSKETSAAARVADAWSKFCESRVELETRYAQEISRLNALEARTRGHD